MRGCFCAAVAGEGKPNLVLLSHQENTESAEKLERAIAVLQAKLKKVTEAMKDPNTVKRERVKCKGGCGFWGDEKSEDYCSVCHKKKIFGIKPSEAEEERVK